MRVKGTLSVGGDGELSRSSGSAPGLPKGLRQGAHPTDRLL